MDVIAVVASTAAPDLAVIDFGAKVSTASFAGNGGGNLVDCHGVLAAVGDPNGGTVTLLSLLFSPHPVWVSSFATGLSRINALAIGDRFLLAAGPGPDGTALVLADIG